MKLTIHTLLDGARGINNEVPEDIQHLIEEYWESVTGDIIQGYDQKDVVDLKFTINDTVVEPKFLLRLYTDLSKLIDEVANKRIAERIRDLNDLLSPVQEKITEIENTLHDFTEFIATKEKVAEEYYDLKHRH